MNCIQTYFIPWKKEHSSLTLLSVYKKNGSVNPQLKSKMISQQYHTTYLEITNIVFQDDASSSTILYDYA